MSCARPLSNAALVADVLVLGAGASGLMAAREAARRGLAVTILERAGRPGRKLALSGGGKANFTNRSVTTCDYLCRPDGEFCAPALSAFPPRAMLDLVAAWCLPVQERDHGRLFLAVPAQRLVQALTSDCAAAGCRLLCGCDVSGLRHDGRTFVTDTSRGQWRARAVILALGSPAWPAAGGTATGWELARGLGHAPTPPRPALTPFLLDPAHPLARALRGLAGVSLPARLALAAATAEDNNAIPASSGARTLDDDLLITHDGLSGPLALGASLFWREGMSLCLDFLPDENVERLLDTAGGGRTPRALLRGRLPQRLLDALWPMPEARRKIAELSRAARHGLAHALQNVCLEPAGLGGLERAEVCSGGVPVSELDARSMESRLMPGLHITGELLDVTGRLGGYNLHWAWASGVSAGRAVLAAPAAC